MGHTHHDPIDHSRTTIPHCGQSFVDVYCWPGLLSIALGVISLIACVAAAAYNRNEWLLTTGVVGALAIAGGVAWLVLEHHRVLRIESQWLAEHAAAIVTSDPGSVKPPTYRAGAPEYLAGVREIPRRNNESVSERPL